MRLYLQTVSMRYKWATLHRNIRGETEVARLGLLQTACAQHDLFYLQIHQIYCMDLKSPDSFRPQAVGLSPEHLHGLEMLIPLLLPNSPQIAKDAMDWFAAFPNPFESMLHEFRIYREILTGVKSCLAKLARHWAPYFDQCMKRHYPPLMDELTSVLGIKSPVLQGVAFRTVLKDLWIGDPNDSCFYEGEKVLRQNQQIVWQRRSHYSDADREADNQKFISAYIHLGKVHAAHQQARHPNSQAGSSPPLNISDRPPSAHAQGQPNGTRYNSQGRAHQGSGPHPPPIDTRLAQNGHIMTATEAQPPSSVLYQQSSPRLLQNVPNVPTIPSSSPSLITSSTGWHATLAPATGNSGSPTAVQPYFNASGQYHTFSSGPRSPAVPWPPSVVNNGQFQYHRPPPPNRHLSNPQSANRATAAPVGRSVNPTAFVQQQVLRSNPVPQVVHQQLLLPPSGQTVSTTAQVTPGITALHQYRALSPILTVVDDSGLPLASKKHFKNLTNVTILRNRLRIGHRQHIEWSFPITEDNFNLLSGTNEESNGSTPTRAVRVGSLFYRLRCVDATKVNDTNSESDWVAASQVWPTNVTVILNEKPLDIRKKIHHGKDLPIDITASVRKGANALSISIIRAQKEDQTEYAVGLESIRLLDMEAAKAMMGILPYDEARLRIMKRFQNGDADVEIVDTSVTINLADPYTSCIWDVPMRARTCRHDQCFDLETFLETRSSNKPSQPCDPDQFKCPICGGDARPQSLVRDEFFDVIRGALALQNRLDVKAIIMQPNGNWRIKEEEKTGEAGDGSGTRFGSRKGPAAATAVTERGGNSRRDSEIIELDDD